MLQFIGTILRWKCLFMNEYIGVMHTKNVKSVLSQEISKLQQTQDFQ